jgi:hypothetical protein
MRYLHVASSRRHATKTLPSLGMGERLLAQGTSRVAFHPERVAALDDAGPGYHAGARRGRMPTY